MVRNLIDLNKSLLSIHNSHLIYMLGKNKKNKIKFQFTTDFQEQILNYTINDIQGYKALNVYEDYYFDLIEHQIIAAGLKSYFKDKHRIPKNRATFKEYLKSLYTHKDIKDSISKDDIKNIQDLVDKLYKSKLKDGEDILEGCLKFASYIKFKNTIEQIDLTDYKEYTKVVKNLDKAIRLGKEVKDDKGTFLIEDIIKRQLDRALKSTVFPFPFWQLNKYTNAGGYGPASIFVLLDKAKGFKTAILANIMRGYLALHKNIILFDLENGEDPLSMRFEQSIARIDKKQLLSGKFDRKIQKILRRYKRLKVELVIKRLPAYSTSQDLKHWLDYYKREHNLSFQVMMVDGPGLMGSENAKVGDDNGRISSAYVELKTLAEEYGVEHVWAPHHVNRPAYPRRHTKYEPTDTSKSIDVHRYVDAMYGVSQNEEEQQQGVYRIEVIDQRDGPPSGTILLWGNEALQRVTEFTKHEAEEWFKQTGKREKEASEEEKQRIRNKQERKRKEGDM